MEKYEWDPDTAQSFADWLVPMLKFDAVERATAQECLDAPFLQDVWQQNPEAAPPLLRQRRSQPRPPSSHLSGLDQLLPEDDSGEAREDLPEEDLDVELNDYDLNEDEMESNLLAMSNSLQILDHEAGVSESDLVPDAASSASASTGSQQSGAGDCFGSTGLFTAM